MQKAGCPAGQISDHNNNTCVVPRQNLKPMVCWPGGKSRVSKEIVDQIPNHNVYVEPFIGGGSVYFQKDMVPVNVINDKNTNLTNFYKTMKKTDPSEMKKCKLSTRRRWDSLKKKRDDGEPLNACEFWQLVNGSYGCMTNTWGFKTDKIGKTIGTNVRKNLGHYQNKLGKTRIISKDYRVMTKYDGKNTFYYVDPPYYKAVDYNQPPVHPDEVAGAFKKVKGKVMISYNDCPEVRKAFPKKDGWRYKYLTIPYTLQGSKNAARQPTKELLIMNY